MKTLADSKHWLWVTVFCSLTLLLSFPTKSQGQYAKVQHIVAKTSEGVSISIWVDKQIVKFGQDVVVRYKIDNFSAKTIYLVHEKEIDLEVEDGIMSIGSPTPFPIGHGRFDYSFTKVLKGKNYQGKLTVPGDRYKGTGPWRIEVALGYIDDISDLDQDSINSRDPAFLRGTLNERLKVVWIGNLRVDILKD